MITLTTSNGKTYEIKEKIDRGGYIKVIYINKDGDELTYFIRVTNSGKLVMN